MKTIVPTIVLACVMALGVMMLGAACSEEEEPDVDPTTGDENTLERAERNANEAQQNFQEEFKEEREFVDEKANKAAHEARKAANKVGDAVSGDDEDEEPEPGKP
jgi:hypothetical protein